MNTPYIVVDIETVPLPESERMWMKPDKSTFKPKRGAKKEETVDKQFAEELTKFKHGEGCGLSAITGQVAIIGTATHEGNEAAIFQTKKHREADILKMFWDMHHGILVDRARAPMLVGHNIKGFDLPFLIRRSWINKVPVPYGVVKDLHKFRSEFIFDTMSEWALGSKGDAYTSLVDICGAFGIPVKEGEINGANIADYWATKPKECVEYCMADVRATRDLFRLINMTELEPEVADEELPF